LPLLASDRIPKEKQNQKQMALTIRILECRFSDDGRIGSIVSARARTTINVNGVDTGRKINDGTLTSGTEKTARKWQATQAARGSEAPLRRSA
jgi:hypothetical protein